MIFGQIDYLNLLPFHIFIKKSSLNSAFKKSIWYKKDIPSALCKKLKQRKIDGAIISSIESRYAKFKKIDLGIVAKGDVKSVIVRKNSTKSLDSASMTSNMLAKILKIDGEILIGDRALKEFLKDPNEFIDLAKIWHKNTNLPFVFAIFCCNKHSNFFKKLSKKFLKSKVKIPRYILKQYSISRGVSQRDILWYLKFISYDISYKEKKAIKLFLKKSKEFNYKP